MLGAPSCITRFPAIAEIKAAAEELAIPLTFVLDPQAKKEDAEKALNSAKISLPDEAFRHLASRALVLQGMMNHYPSAVLFTEEDLSPVLPGYKDRKTYLKFFRKYVPASKGASQ